MPSRHSYPGTSDYKVVSVVPGIDGNTLIKRLSNGKGETLIRISDKDPVDKETNGNGETHITISDKDMVDKNENTYIKYRTSTNKSKSKHRKKKDDENSNNLYSVDSIKYTNTESDHLSNYPKTRAHHILYTKTPTATFFRKPEESTMETYKTRHISKSRPSEGDAKEESQEIELDANIRLYRKVNNLEINSLQEKNDINNLKDNVEIAARQNQVSDTGITIGRDQMVAEGNMTDFKEEAARLIEEYKKKMGSRDNLDVDSNVNGDTNGYEANEMLRDKTIIVSHNGKQDQKKTAGNLSTNRKSLVSKDACFQCGVVVYQKDKVGPIRDVRFHGQCFRCSKCGTVLTLYNFYQNHKDTQDRSVYCKSHQPYTESSKGDIADKNIQAVINKPKLDRVNSNVRGGLDSKNSIGPDAVSIKYAMNAPKLGTYNPTVRLAFDSEVINKFDRQAVNEPRRMVQRTQSARVASSNATRQRGERNYQTLDTKEAVHYGPRALHSLYLHQPEVESVRL